MSRVVASRVVKVLVAVVAAFALVTFGAPALVVHDNIAAAVGLVLYVAAFAALRPRGFAEAWQYVRLLHH